MLMSLIRMYRTCLRKRAAFARISRLDDRGLREPGLSRSQLLLGWGCE